MGRWPESSAANSSIALSPYFDFFESTELFYWIDRDNDGRSRPSTTALHDSPAAIDCDSVSVPELTSSPAQSCSSGMRVAMAAASSPTQSAGLRREFLPEPSATVWPFFSNRTVNRAS